MFQGYYTLGSTMISQNRNLNVISNNMANAATTGYKSDQYIASTFREEMLYRSGNITPHKRTPIGTTAMIQATNARVTNYEQGALEPTEMDLDVALQGNGFFVIQTADDELVYSRNGSFITDDEGYLAMPSVGRVMGTNGPIHLTTDNVTIDANGRITNSDTAEYYATLQLVDFEDYAELIKGNNGTFTAGEEAVEQNPENLQVVQGMLERSNTSMVDEMTSMIAAQRSLQAAAQMIKMYDTLDGRTVTIGSMS